MPAPPLYPSLPPGAAAPQPPLGGHYPSAPAQPYPPVGVCPTPPQHCQGHWVPASSGHIPPYAVGGGFDHGSEIFVARAHFRGALLPGKLVSGHRCCYVAWGGKEHSCSHYEVILPVIININSLKK